MSGDDGGGGDDGKKKGRGNYYVPSQSAVGAICCFLLVLIFIAGITALVLYFVYRPSKPRFTVASAAIYDINVTTPSASAISTRMQFTLIGRNPSGRASAVVDRLAAYVSYMNQPITPPTPIPPLYLDHDSTVAVSPVIGGDAVPVSTDVSGGLASDLGYGVVGLRVVLMGRIKYKSGPFQSPWYSMFVACDLLLGAKKGASGPVALLGNPACHVDV